jgi:hypothetical protein
VASIAKRPDGRWRARYRDPQGREHARHFTRKTDAQKWVSTNRADIARGQWIDPRHGELLVRDIAERWRLGQMHRPTTAAHVETMFRRHIVPAFGDRRIASVKQSDVQAWVTAKSTELSPATVRVVYSFLAAVFRSAVADGLIARTPCKKIRLPEA